jgi:hypothetical protein
MLLARAPRARVSEHIKRRARSERHQAGADKTSRLDPCLIEREHAVDIISLELVFLSAPAGAARVHRSS